MNFSKKNHEYHNSKLITMSKKLILMLAVVAVVSFTFTSCKNDKKEETKTEQTASNELYQCPMDCEDGKSYTEPGTCPVCKMDLKAKKVDMDDDSHEDGH